MTCRPGSFGSRSTVFQRPSVASIVTGVRAVTGVPFSSSSLIASFAGVLPSATAPPWGRPRSTLASAPGAFTLIVTLPRGLPKPSTCESVSTFSPGFSATPMYSQPCSCFSAMVERLPTCFAGTSAPFTARVKVEPDVPFTRTVVCASPSTCPSARLMNASCLSICGSTDSRGTCSSIARAEREAASAGAGDGRLSVKNGTAGCVVPAGCTVPGPTRLALPTPVAPGAACTRPLAGSAFTSVSTRTSVASCAFIAAASSSWPAEASMRDCTASTTAASQPAIAKSARPSSPAFRSTMRLPASPRLRWPVGASAAPPGSVRRSAFTTWVRLAMP